MDRGGWVLLGFGGRGVAVGGVVRWCMGRRLGSYQWEFLRKDFIAFNPRINPQTY